MTKAITELESRNRELFENIINNMQQNSGKKAIFFENSIETGHSFQLTENNTKIPTMIWMGGSDMNIVFLGVSSEDKFVILCLARLYPAKTLSYIQPYGCTNEKNMITAVGNISD